MGRTDIALAWLGGEYVAMLRDVVRKGTIVDLEHGFARHRESLNASREARTADIV